uniref:Protein SCAI n=1 Tax=Kalanchoe fedtschenkoi TaxID=63787 RepID=A0A7N0T7I4_KALFE
MKASKSNDDDGVSSTFKALVQTADRKFARVRDVPPAHGRASPTSHYFHKVFKAHMRLWKFQQENRARLVEAGLQRWEIGEIASRIGQLYFAQYMRTSEMRFLFEAYIFYEAILSRGYFKGSGVGKDLGVRYKELRFYARFLMVAVILSRADMVAALMEAFKAALDDCKATFKETNFREWKLVYHEISRFTKADTVSLNVRPLRYSPMIDSHPDSAQSVARFHAKKILKFQDALLTSYHRNEVKFSELTMDTFRMLQCLEWEPSGSFHQKRPVKPYENGSKNDYSVTSGFIEMNLAMDTTDSSLPPNPKKAVLYRPSVTHLLATMATICEELPADNVMLIYLSASGKDNQSNLHQTDSSGGSRVSSKKASSESSHEECSSMPEAHLGEKSNSLYRDGSCLWLGPKGNGSYNKLYPGDLIPFTRKPLFIIIDSDNSHAFKAGITWCGERRDSWTTAFSIEVNV